MIVVETVKGNIVLHVFSSKFLLEAIYNEPYCKCLKKIKIGSKPNDASVIVDAMDNIAYAEVYNPSEFDLQVFVDMFNLQEAYITALSSLEIYRKTGDKLDFVRRLSPNQTALLYRR